MLRKKNIFDKPLPKHIAIILDGNGRWAKHRALPRSVGHYKGAYNLKNIAVLCDEIGINTLTVFAFSTENWNRPKDEVNYLMKTPVSELKKHREKIINGNIKITIIGRKDRIPLDLKKTFIYLEEKTKDKKGLHLVICFDYGSHFEIKEATKAIANKVNKGEIKLEDINEKMIEENLYTHDLPRLDLLIRTSGEFRISNFLLWQLGYAELYFTKCLWPSFGKKELYDAIYDYQNRKRRFGKVE